MNPNPDQSRRPDQIERIDDLNRQDETLHGTGSFDYRQTARDLGRRAERTFARTGDTEFMGNVRRFIKEKPGWAAAGLAALFLIGRRR